MEAIFGLFHTYEEAREAVSLLLDRRFRPESMNAIVQDYVVREWLRGRMGRANVLATELKPGLDRILAGQRPLDVPDAGSVLAAGAEATTIAKTASLAESRSEGLEPTLEHFGLPPEVAADCLAALKGGGVVFWVKTDDARAPDAAVILKEHKARHVGSYTREAQPAF
ncbi:MAG: hypothetical protein M0017_05635 [Desulfobacteraceae bacterium]|nr:hypothetical protein [Desulfobacteraceae bacterium]